MKCLVLRHVAFEDLGTFERVLTRCDFSVHYRQAGVDPLEEQDWIESDLVIVLGGPVGVYETDTYPWLTDEIAAIGRRLKRRQPILGICLGAQLMAAALGARVYATEAKEIGWATLQLETTETTNCLSHLAEVSVLHWHGDTFELPVCENVMRLASTSKTLNQAFSVGSFALGLQFHPEVNGANIEPWLIGHACELHHADVAVVRVRDDSHRFAAACANASEKVLMHWLRDAGLISHETEIV